MPRAVPLPQDTLVPPLPLLIRAHLLVATLFALGCGEPCQQTQVDVQVEASAAVMESLARWQLQVFDSEQNLAQELSFRFPDEVGRSFTLRVRPRGRDASRSWHLIATALDAGDQTIGQAEARGGYVSNSCLSETVTVTDNCEAGSACALCHPVTSISKSECKALVQLYQSTSGEQWADNTGWLETEDPCTWHGVTCVGQHVDALVLNGNGLSGALPPSIVDLSELRLLDLSVTDSDFRTGDPDCADNNQTPNQITAIAPELGALSKLEELILGCADIEGSIPKELGNLDNLHSLWLHENQLSGSIPPELGNLTKLAFLALNGNQLSGSIPPELGSLPELERLLLYQNELTGSIPPELGNLSKLKALWFQSNSIGGTLPPELGNLSNLVALFAANNQLSGRIPSEFGNLTSCVRFSLHANALSGVVPDSLMSIPATDVFTLHGQDGCLTCMGSTFCNWLTQKDPNWNDGCMGP